MVSVTSIIEIINANGRQGPRDLKSQEVYNWVKRNLDISYDDYLSILNTHAIPHSERQRIRNAYFVISPTGVYSFFKSTEEELRPYICYVIYRTPNLRSSEIKERTREIYQQYTLIDMMLQLNLSSPQCVIDQTIRNVLVSNYNRQANFELFERSAATPYHYTIKPAGIELALRVEQLLSRGLTEIPPSVRSWIRNQAPALITALPYSPQELAAIREKNAHFHYQPPVPGHAEHRDRDLRLKATRLAQAGYTCAADAAHRTFAAPSMPNFVECHHIIPLAAQRELPNTNLDCLENLVPLCPTCHSAIHCGTAEVRRAMFALLLDRFGSGLESIGISREQALSLFAAYCE